MNILLNVHQGSKVRPATVWVRLVLPNTHRLPPHWTLIDHIPALNYGIFFQPSNKRVIKFIGSYF